MLSELLKLSSINKVSLVSASSSGSNIASIRDDPYWTSRKNWLSWDSQLTVRLRLYDFHIWLYQMQTLDYCLWRWWTRQMVMKKWNQKNLWTARDHDSHSQRIQRILRTAIHRDLFSWACSLLCSREVWRMIDNIVIYKPPTTQWQVKQIWP